MFRFKKSNQLKWVCKWSHCSRWKKKERKNHEKQRRLINSKTHSPWSPCNYYHWHHTSQKSYSWAPDLRDSCSLITSVCWTPNKCTFIHFGCNFPPPKTETLLFFVPVKLKGQILKVAYKRLKATHTYAQPWHLYKAFGHVRSANNNQWPSKKGLRRDRVRRVFVFVPEAP